MINNLPNGWKIENLENLGKVFTGSSAPQEEKYFNNGKYPFIRVSDLSNKKFNKKLSNVNDYINDECLNDKKQTFAKKGTIVFAKSGMSVKNNHRALLDIDGYIVSHLCAIYIEEKYTREYIYYLLCKLDMVKFSENEAYPSLKTSIIKSIQVPIPPLQQQEKIVKVLDLTSNLIEKQKELLEKYDLFLKSKFIEMFGDPISNPMGWEVIKLGDYTKLVSSGSTPKGGQSVYLEDGEIRFIRSQNVRMNKMDFNGIYYISEEIYDKMKRTQVQYNDVLLNITGASIGRTAIYKDNKRANVNQHVCIIRLEDSMNSCFINYFIGSDSFQNQILSNQSGATREALNFTQIKNFNIFNVPIELQNQFASIVEKIETIKEKENQKLKQLEDLHNSLMNKAFKGEIE